MKEINIKPLSKEKRKKGYHAFLASIVPSFYVYLIFLYLFLDLKNPTKSGYGFPFLVTMIIFIYWFYYKSDSTRRIWGRMLASSAVLSFILPVAIFIGGIKETVKQDNALSAIGTGIGVGIATIFLGFLFLLIGLAFAVSAYFVNKPLKK